MGSDSASLGAWTPAAFGRVATLSVTTFIVQAGFGFLSLALVGLSLTPEMRGYYFTFVALVSLFPLAEFGASYALMQSVSHESSHLEWGPAGLSGSRESLRLVSGVLRMALVWNTCTTFLACCALVVAGERLFGRQLETAWLTLLAVAAGRQLLTPCTALLEGSGRAADVWHFRIHQELLGGTVLAACLLGGAGLYSLPASWLVRFIHAGVWLIPHTRRISGGSWKDLRSVVPYWSAHVWPFQWRIGTSVLAGFLTYYLFNPLLLVIRGPVEAGRFGMSLAITGGWQNATTAWVTSQAPRYGSLIATQRRGELDTAFRRTFLRTMGLSAAGWLVLVVAMVYSVSRSEQVALRLLPPLGFAALTATAVVNNAVLGLAVYLRAHRRDPFLIPSVIGAIATPLVTIWAAQRGSASLVALLYLGLTLVGLTMAAVIFVQARERWTPAAMRQ